MQATQPNTTPTGAAAPPAALPSILDLGRNLRSIRDAHEEADAAFLKARLPEMERVHEKRMMLLHQQDRAICALVLNLPAQTIADAFVQVVLADEAAEGTQACESDLDDYRKVLAALRRVLASITPILSAAAGLPVEAVSWAPYPEEGAAA